jgi:hypothetical protein
MTPNSKKIALIMSIFLTVLFASTFAISRRQRGEMGEDLGVFSAISGRVEMRASTSRTWINPALSKPAPSGVGIRVGSGSATISNTHGQIKLGPDTDISTRWKNKKLEITLHSGEIEFIKNDGLPEVSISTDFGDVLMSEPASFIVSRPPGAKFAVVIPRSGLISVAQHSESRPIVAGSSPVVLSAKNVSAIWALDPAPGINLDSIEGHQAVTFSWAEARYLVDSKSATTLPSILIRNLATGEMVVQENAESPAEYTLPSGPYSWVVRIGEMVTSPRLFQITGTSIQSASADEPRPEKILPEAVDPQPQNPLPVSEDSTPPAPSTPRVDPEPTAASAATIKNSVPATVALLLPHKGVEIPFSMISEQRVQWKATGSPESFELDILGSAGNPSLHFTLLGHRTRQKLMLLPPGRYTVRIRTTTGVAPAQVSSDWVESFFDVVQTEAGQLSPQNIEYKVTSVNKRSVITVIWDKGPAPQYQIKMTAASLPTTLILTKRHKATLKLPESGNASISVCALDANKRVRGCAPDIHIP